MLNHNINIAIVEDLESGQQLSNLLFGSFTGMKLTIVARDGEEMLQKLETATPFPDIVLLNVVLGKGRMQGLDTARALLKLYPRLKIAVFSMCSADDPRVQHMLEAGCTGYISKSAEPKQIENRMWELTNN